MTIYPLDKIKQLLPGLLFFLITGFDAKSQDKNFQVTYQGIIYFNNLMKSTDSITSNHIIGEDTIKEKTDYSSMPANMGLPIVTSSVMITGNRVVLLSKQNAGATNVSENEKPDSSVYENGKWYNYINGNGALKENWSGSLQKTQETRNIYGYICNKYIWTADDNSRQTELWVTEALPHSISPYPVNIPVKGAILESRQLSSNFTYKLVDLIEK